MSMKPGPFGMAFPSSGIEPAAPGSPALRATRPARVVSMSARYSVATVIAALAVITDVPPASAACSTTDLQACGAATTAGQGPPRTLQGGLGDGGGGDASFTGTSVTDTTGGVSSNGTGGLGATGQFPARGNTEGAGGNGGSAGGTVAADLNASHTGGAGQAGGPDLSDDQNAGGGGGGGAGVFVPDSGAMATIAVGMTIAGGRGGNGGDITNNGNTVGNAGSAGGGGAGVLVTGTTLNLTNNGAIIGGAGGTGGNLGFAGSGGGGGDGLLLGASGGSVNNNGTITGGAGGVAGAPSSPGSPRSEGGDGGGGAGVNIVGSNITFDNSTGTITGGNASGANGQAPNAGVGIVVWGANGTLTNEGTIVGGNATGSAVAGVGVLLQGGMTFTNSGTISGGTNGGTTADGVLLTGGGNTIVLEPGSVSSKIESTSGTTNADTIKLDGASSASLNLSQVVGFSQGTKIGSNTWTLTGTPSGAINWTVQAGTLSGSTGTLTGNIGLSVGGSVTFNQAAAGIYSQTMSGAGSLTKTGAGTLTLSGTNTFSGGTTITAGTLQGDSTSLQGAIADNAALAFNQASAGTYAGAVSGTGSLTKTGAGTLTLSGTNSYTGGTTITAGTLQGDGTSLQGTIADNAALVFNQAAAGSYAGAVTGTGSLTKTGAGRLTLSGTNSYTGGTTISAGTLQGDSTSLQGTIADNAALVFNQAGAGTYAGVITGTGSLTKMGAGTLTLSGANTYTGSTTITAGTLQGDSTSLQGAVVDNAALAFNQASTGTYASAISGTGSVTKMGFGALTLSSVNTYTGGTSLNAGTLVVGGNNALGTGTLAMAANTALNFNGSITISNAITVAGDPTFNVGTGSTVTLTGAIADGGVAGDIVKTGAGVLVTTAANTYTGGTTISAGTLQLGNGGTAGSITGNVSDGGILAFNRSDAVSFAGTISGAGSVEQDGAGTVTLTGTNTYTGGTVVRAGTLSLANGAAAGSGTITLDDGSALLLASGITVANNLVIIGTTTLEVSGGTATESGTITGSGTYIVRGSGTLVLTGDNSQFSGAVGISGVTLDLGTDQTLGSATISVLGNAGLTYANGQTLANAITIASGVTATITVAAGQSAVQAGMVSGAGTLVIGGGTFTLSGTNSYTGGTTLNSGTLVVGSNTALGTGTLAMAANTELDFSGNITLGNAMTVAGDPTFNVGTGSTVTLSAVIADGGVAGDIVKIGAGTLVTTADNTFTGGTTITAGTLQLGNGGITGSVIGTIVDNAALVIDHAGSMTVAGVISGTGTVAVIGPGTVTLSGANTYSGGTSLTGGVLAVAADAAFGTGGLSFNGGTLETTASVTSAKTISLAGAGTIQVDAGVTTTLSGVISGAGMLTQAGTGTLVLTGANSYTGGTVISAGTLQGDSTSLQGTITDNAALVFNQAAAGTYAGALGGTGSVTKTGVGTLTLTGANGYTGGTSLTGGVLAVAADAALGTGGLSFNGGTLETTASVTSAKTISLAGAGTIQADTGVTTTLSGVISGAGTLATAGAGTLILTGANSYTGGTTITAGTLQGDSTSLQGAITDNAALVFNQVSAGTYAGAVSGTGSLTKTGLGALTLSGTSGLTGSTTVSAGRLIVNGALGSAVLVAAGASLSGSGSVGDLTIFSGGTLQVAAGQTLTSGALTLQSGSILATSLGTPGPSALVNALGNLTLGGTLNVTDTGGFGVGVYTVIAYGGSLTNNGMAIGSTPSGLNVSLQTAETGKVNLAVTSSASAALSFWDGGTNPVTDNAVDGGNGVWSNTTTNWTDQAGDQDSTRQVSASVVVFEGNAGTVTVDDSAGSPSVSGIQFARDGYRLTGGAITLLAGADTIRVGDGSAGGASDTAVIAAPLTGAGGLVKTDLGTLVLAGANTYAGSTEVANGTLAVNGSIMSPVTVDAGGTLHGSGTINAPVTVAGDISPGNSPGVLTVTAPVTLTASGTFTAEIDGATAGNGSGHFDQLNVTGGNSFSAAGTLQLVLRGILSATNSYIPALGSTYAIINADGGVNGRFATVVQPISGLMANTEFDAFYTGNTVTLAVLPNSFAAFAAHSNGRAVGAALDLLKAGGTGSANGLAVLTGVAAQGVGRIADTLEDLSGEIHATALASRIDTTLHLHEAIGDQVAAYALSEDATGNTSDLGNRTQMWLQGIGDVEDRGDNATGRGFNASGAGVVAGVQHAFGVGGFAGLAFSHTSTKVTQEQSGQANITGDMLAAYGGWRHGRFYVSALASYSWDDYGISRSVNLAGGGQSQGSSPHGRTYGADLQGGYRLLDGPIALDGLVGLDGQRASVDATAESGSATSALAFGGAGTSVLQWRAGLKASTSVNLAGGHVLRPDIHVTGYQTLAQTNGSSGIGANLQGVGFTTSAANAGRFGIAGGGGISLSLTKSAELFIRYDIGSMRNTLSQNATGGVKIKW